MNFENKLAIGSGIYTIAEITKILRLPYHKVNTWVNTYWDGKLGQAFQSRYSWTVNKSKAVSFHTLVEFYILFLLAQAGVKTNQVLKAHLELSKIYNTPFPFAQKNILKGIRTDGKKIFFNTNGGTISLDGKFQFQIEFVKLFFKNLEFDDELLANRFYPLGKKRNIVVDPTRQFGHPVIGNTNIYPETIFNLYKAGEPTKFIAHLYEINEKEVQDAIEYCKAA